VWHFPGVRDLPPGPAGVKQLVRNILAGNPNFKLTLEDLVVEGDKVAVRHSFRRTDPASGKLQHGTELAIARFVGDKFAEDWELISPWEDD
jgi:predicted ester cyclase